LIDRITLSQTSKLAAIGGPSRKPIQIDFDQRLL